MTFVEGPPPLPLAEASLGASLGAGVGWASLGAASPPEGEGGQPSQLAQLEVARRRVERTRIFMTGKLSDSVTDAVDFSSMTALAKRYGHAGKSTVYRDCPCGETAHELNGLPHVTSIKATDDSQRRLELAAADP